MNNTYEFIADIETIRTQSIELLEPFTDKYANWNHKRFEFLYTIIYNRLVNASPVDCNIYINSWYHMTFTVFISNTKMVEYCRSIYPEINVIVKARSMRSIFAILIHHLSSKKLVRCNDRYFPKFSLSISIANSPLFEALPRPVKFFCFIQTKSKFILFRNYLNVAETNVMDGFNDAFINSATWNNCTTAFRRFLFHNGLSSFEEITSPAIKAYKIRLGNLNLSYGFNPFLNIASILSGNDLNSVLGSQMSFKKELQFSENEYNNQEYSYLEGNAAYHGGLVE